METDVEILLIEDNVDEAQLVIRSLKKNNLANRLLHIDDGEEALDFIFARVNYADRKSKPLPSLILLDLKLPKVDGMEILKQIKSDPVTRAIPVVILSSSAVQHDVVRCYELGANSYVVKPVSFDALGEVLKGLGTYWLMLNEPPNVLKR
jgi:two-component system response regulator